LIKLQTEEESTPLSIEGAHARRIRDRMLQLGTASVFQWSQIPQDESWKIREAGPAIAPCCVLLVYLAKDGQQRKEDRFSVPFTAP
jgi:hypothetical protein